MAAKWIEQLQSDLVRLEYNPGPVDGLPGPRTRSAVVEFQRDHGLLADGIAGPRTLHALRIALEEMRETREEPSAPPAEPLREEARGASLTLEHLRRAILASGHSWSTSPKLVHIIGVRGWRRGAAVENRLDEYNDTIYLAAAAAAPGPAGGEPDGPAVEEFPASVDPGRLREPNPKGTAHLLPGRYEYRLGLHRGREPALVQAGPVTVLRYFDVGDRDWVPQRESGWFGINIHRGGRGTHVGAWSAGCQVIRGEVWARFLERVRAASDAGQEIFPYTLLEGRNLEVSLKAG